jgi:Holliday junction resolvase
MKPAAAARASRQPPDHATPRPHAHEAKIVRAMADLMRSRGVWFIKTHGAGFGRAGVPDFVACVRHRFVGVEVKTTASSSRTTSLQERELTQITRAGGVAAVLRSREGLAWLLDILESPDHELDGLAEYCGWRVQEDHQGRLQVRSVPSHTEAAAPLVGNEREEPQREGEP